MADPTPAQLEFARRLCRWGGVPDAPKLLLLAVLGMPVGKRLLLLEELSPEQVYGFRAMTPAGRLGLLVEDMVNEARDGLHRNRVRRLAHEELR